jgi:hypothetical protein
MAVLLNEYKKIQYMIDSLVLPFIKSQHPKWRELIRVYLEFLDEHPLNKSLNITDNVDANTMYSELLDEFLNLYFKDVIDINKFGLNDDNKRLFISLSKLIGNLKATKTSYGFFFNSFTDFSIPTDSGDINIDDMTIDLVEKPDWWLTNNDPTRPFTYIFKIDNTNLSNLKELIKEVHPAGWIQLFLMEVLFQDYMTGFDCFELDVHWGAYHNGKWNHDGVMTVEGGEVTFYHNGGYTKSDPINCAAEPKYFTSNAAITSGIISAFTPGALEVYQDPLGGHLTSVPGDDTWVFTVDAGPSPTSWQWYNGSGAIPGEITDTLTITGATEDDTDIYYCVISNGGPPIESDYGYLVVTVCPIAFNDDFDGNNDDPPDESRWEIFGDASIQSNQLFLNLTGAISVSRAWTIYGLAGDFTATVDYSLVTPTEPWNSWHILLEAWRHSSAGGGAHYFYQQLTGGENPHELYSVVHSDGANLRIVHTPWGGHNVGKFRLIRYGQTVETWAWNSAAGWVMTTSYTGDKIVTNDPVFLRLRCYNASPYNPQQDVYFDNLVVEGSCADVPYLGEFASQSDIVYSIPDAEFVSPIHQDTFPGEDGTQPVNWTNWENDGDSASIFENSIRFTSMGDEYAGYYANFDLIGDFDLQWNYEWYSLDSQAADSYIKIGVSAYHSPTGLSMNISLNNYDWLTPDDSKYAYHTRTNLNNGGNSYNYAEGTIGKMRYTRVGSVAKSYFWDEGSNLGAGGWQQTARGDMSCYTPAVTPVIRFKSDLVTSFVDARLYNFIVRSADEISFH